MKPRSEPAPPPPHAAPAESADASPWIRAAVEQYEVPLTQYATRLLRGDVERARDVVQDAFVKLWEADRDEIASHLGQWLYRVCRNRALDVRRKESRMTALEDAQLDNLPRRSAHQADGAGAHSAGEMHSPAVIDMLDSLNDTQQEALRLKFQGGLSYKEIAAVMDITSNHVGVLIHNAIKALRERMTAAAEGAAGPVAQRVSAAKGVGT